MCGRLNQFDDLPLFSYAKLVFKAEWRRMMKGEARRRRKANEDKRTDSAPVFNICPSDYGDAITLDGDDLIVERMRFGLVPRWAKGSKAEVWRKFMVTFNARSESIFDLPSYRQAIRSQRCLVPVSGWHEWPDRTTPYYIHRADNEPLLLAGIWDIWESHHLADEETGPVVTSMSVITTPPGRYMGKFHDRSPLVLQGEAALAWLQPGLEKDDLRDFMQPGDDSFLEAWRVSTAANNAKNKGAEVCQPIGPPVPQEGDGGPEPGGLDNEELKLF